MYFDRLFHSLRLPAIALFSVLLFACGKGEGPEEVVDPLFVGGPPPAVVPPPPPPPPPPASGAVFDDVVDAQWLDASIAAFDQAIGFSSCVDDDGAGCPSISWSVVAEAGRGNVIEVTYATTTDFAGLIVGQTLAGLDFGSFAGGNIVFDLNVTNNPNNQPMLMKIDCVGCPTDAGQREQNLGVPGAGWQTITVAVDDIVNANGGPGVGGLVLSDVTTGLVIFPPFGQTSDVVYRIDNVRWEAAGPPPPPPVSGAVFDDVVDGQWIDASIAAFDQAIGFSSCVDDDGAGCPSIGWSIVAEAGRGNVIEVTYATTTDFAGLIVGQTLAGLDFSSFAGGNIVFDLNVTNNPTNQPFRMKIDCVGCPTDAGQREQDLGVPGAGWQTITVAVDDIVNSNGGPGAGGLVLSDVTTGLVIFPPFGQTSDVVYRIDNVRWEAAGGGGGGQLLTNGDFEAGDLSGWTSAANGGTITADNTQDSGSTWSASVVAGPGNNPALSQVNLAVGTVTTGDLIDISFDMCGTLGGLGGVVIPAVLSEFGVGMGADRQDLDTFTDATLPSVWTRYNYQAIAGANVTGGVSLQLDVICGGDPSCAANVYFDNVSATIGGGMVPGTASGLSCAAAPPPPPPVTGAVFDDAVDAQWVDASIAAFDQAIGFSNCTDDDGAGCPSIGWSVVAEAGRGNVIEVTYATTTDFAGLIIGQTIAGLDFSSFAGGNIVFDLNVTNNPTNQPFRMKIDCVGCPTDAGQREQDLGVPGAGWQTITVAVDDIVNSNGGPGAGGLVLGQTTTGLVIFPPFGQTSDVVYRIDNVRWEAAPPPPPPVTGAVFDDAVDAQWVDASIAAFDQAIGFGSCVDDDGAGCPSIGWSIVAEAGRGNVIEVTYATTTNFAGLILGQTLAGLDFSSFAGGNIVFDLNVTNNPTNQPFRMKIDCVGCPTDAGQREQDLGVPGAGWQTITVAVDDIVNSNGGPGAGGLVLGQTTTGLVIFPPFGQTSDVVYRIDNVRWEAAGGPGPGGELAVNGGLETGDFTGWQQFVNSGVQTISTDTPSGSSFSAALSGNTAPGLGGTTEIKQANLGAGTLALGDVVRIQFDVKGTFGPGGLLNVLSFTEFGGGGATLSDNTGIDGAFNNGVDIGNGWFHYDYNVTLSGADADGGFSLAFNPVCGAVAGCVADVLIDNVSIIGP